MADPEQYDTGETASVKKKRREFDLRQERNDAELQAIVNKPGGAYLIWRMLRECGLYSSAGSLEPQNLAYAEGKRTVGQWLLGELVAIDEKLYQKVRNIGTHRDKGSDLDA